MDQPLWFVYVLLIPLIILFLTVWIMLRLFFKSWHKQMQTERVQKNQKQIISLRLQAYERLVLFLERITTDSLLVREKNPDMNVRQYHSHLLAIIRNEFEHNLSQQIYVSSKAWSYVRNAREGMIKMINSAMMQLDPEAPSIELSKKLLNEQIEEKVPPTYSAINYLKKEVSALFG